MGKSETEYLKMRACITWKTSFDLQNISFPLFSLSHTNCISFSSSSFFYPIHIGSSIVYSQFFFTSYSLYMISEVHQVGDFHHPTHGHVPSLISNPRLVPSEVLTCISVIWMPRSIMNSKCVKRKLIISTLLRFLEW